MEATVPDATLRLLKAMSTLKFHPVGVYMGMEQNREGERR